VHERARGHAALAEPHRLAIVDHLAWSDRSPGELRRHIDVAGNLLAHHLDVLEEAELIERFLSSGDRRRRYVRLRQDRLARLAHATARPAGTALFVCTQNSARSQLAAALWRQRTGCPAESAGTDPADRVHPGAVAAAARAGLDLGTATPALLDPDDLADVDVVVTVCDQAHERFDAAARHWHWSTVDPVPEGTDAAFDAAIADLQSRIPESDPSAPDRR
jgi:protein-tyrosine-phosphatase